MSQEEKQLTGHLAYLKGLRDKADWNWDARAHLTLVIEYLETLLKKGSALVSREFFDKANECLDIQSKNGCRLVSIGTDLPKPSALLETETYPTPPRTHQELCNLLSCLNRTHFGTIVDQLRASGYVDYAECRSLYSHLIGLAQESDKFLRKLETNLENKRNQLVAEQASQK